MAGINFTIAGSVLTYQPSGIHEIYADTVVNTTLSGSRVVIEPSVGPIVEVLWGVDAANAGVINHLRTVRPSSGSVAISYTDATGATVNRTVYMPKIPYQQFLKTDVIAQLTLQFLTL